MLIDLVQLRTFVAVAEERHLTRASERLHISQSAASAHVRGVEETLDTVLFVRTNRNLELTHAGRLLLKKAKEVLNEASLFTSFARELRGKTEGHLVVGSSSDPTASRIGGIMAVLRERHPYISVDLRARPSSGNLQGLKTGELDIGIFLGKPVDPQLTYIALDSVPFRVAGPAAWKAQIEKADWAELANLPWVTPTDRTMAYAMMLSGLFGDRGLELNTIVQFDNEAIGRALMQAGVGMTLVREEHALRGEEEGTLAISPIARTEFSLVLAYNASRGGDPLVQAFVDAAGEAWPGAAPSPTP
ncbi:MAG: LysR family transcriptional regulator [Pseudomonadota bacterium]